MSRPNRFEGLILAPGPSSPAPPNASSPEPPPVKRPNWFSVACVVVLNILVFWVVTRSADPWEKSVFLAAAAASVVFQFRLLFGPVARSWADWASALGFVVAWATGGVVWYHQGSKPTDWIGVLGVLPLVLALIWYGSWALIRRRGEQNEQKSA